MAQLNGLPSIAAAAEWSVTFGDCSYRWKARLLSCLGSSAAQGTGGRVRTPAPTEYPETRLSLRRGRSQTGPRAHTVRPYGMAWAARPGGRALRASWSTEGGRPHGAAPTVETDHLYNQDRSPHPSRPAGRASLPLLAFGHFPLIGGIGLPLGEGLRAADSRPYGGKRTGSVGWGTQAQSENRSKISLCTPRAPVGPDSNVPKHSWFCAPEMFCPLQGVTLVMGVRG